MTDSENGVADEKMDAEIGGSTEILHIDDDEQF